ncbi:MAG: nucleotidyltransferase substrate binding protein [Elusimicrobiales bacterium]|nr:nucleotidyltransferase substrate binding protein [Elusimicrobiales bacterium]
MKKNEVLLAIESFKKAFLSLKKGAKTAKNDLERDGVVQRFEFSFELFWKTLKIILEFHGKNADSPRMAIKEAVRSNFLVDDEVYLDMLEDRNRTSHIYDESVSKEIFDRIKKFYIPAFEAFLKNISKISN